jgi:signal transduction histidine kinase
MAWKIQLRRYTFALGLSGLALAARALLNPILGNNDPYVPLFAAVACAAWFLGPGPAVFTTAIGAVGTVYWFIEPRGNLEIPSLQDRYGVAIFVLVSGAIIAFGQRARYTAAQLRLAERDLEAKVRVRTAELVEANSTLQKMSRELMQMQDQERRRIARELHDSVGQSLAITKTNLDLIVRSNLDPNTTARLIGESQSIVERTAQEVRTISHLLHPPLLDEVGLRSALSRFVDGFSQRSHTVVNLEIVREFGRFPADVELSIFRIVQECLTNIHKHSGATTATIRIDTTTANKVLLTVSDNGVGIPQGKTAGIGLAGMRERVLQLGGSFDVQSNRAGTTVSATLPLPGKGTAASVATA